MVRSPLASGDLTDTPTLGGSVRHMGEGTDPRWVAAVEVLDRINASATPPALVREGLSLLVRQDAVLVRSRLRSEEPVAAREVEVGRALVAAGVPVVPLVGGTGQPWV